MVIITLIDVKIAMLPFEVIVSIVEIVTTFVLHHTIFVYCLFYLPSF